MNEGYILFFILFLQKLVDIGQPASIFGLLHCSETSQMWLEQWTAKGLSVTQKKEKETQLSTTYLLVTFSRCNIVAILLC